MNNNDNSLIGFLKKKSLFQNSPTKNMVKKMSKSKSKEGKDSIIRKFNDKQLLDEPPRLHHINSERHLKPELNKFGRQQHFSFFDNNHINKVQSRVFQKNPQERNELDSKGYNNKLITGMLNYGTSFESARVQSSQCLQTLSLKLSTEISNINYKVDQFRNNMSRILHNQLRALHNKIIKLVDEAFKESQESIREYMKIQEQKLAGDVIKMRELLEKEYIRVETMKEEINKPQWRKIAGEILSTELEKNIEEIIKKGNQTEIKRWQNKDLSGQRLKNLEIELKNLVRLKE